MRESPTPPETPGRETSSSRKSIPYLPFIIAFFIIDAIVLGVVLWAFRKPATPPGEATTSTPTPAATVVPPHVQKSVPTPSAATTYTLFLPNEQALLSRQSVTDKAGKSSAPSYGEKAKRSLELLFSKTEIAPAGIRVLEAPSKEKDGAVRVNLSKQFMELDKQPHTPVGLLLDAMSSTLGAIESRDGKNIKPAKVRILVEGKPLVEFSEFDLSEPFQNEQPLPTNGSGKAEDAA